MTRNRTPPLALAADTAADTAVVTEDQIREKLTRRIAALTGRPDYRLPPSRGRVIAPPVREDAPPLTADQIRKHLIHRYTDSLERWPRCPNLPCRRARRCAGEALACLRMAKPAFSEIEDELAAPPKSFWRKGS